MSLASAVLLFVGPVTAAIGSWRRGGGGWWWSWSWSLLTAKFPPIILDAHAPVRCHGRSRRSFEFSAACTSLSL